jgi:hypothetical protein
MIPFLIAAKDLIGLGSSQAFYFKFSGFQLPNTLASVYFFTSSSVSCFDHGTLAAAAAPGP